MKTNMRRPIAVAAILCAVAAPGLSATQVISGITCGRSPCPRPLQLVDGEAVTVTLSGERLGGLVSGVVTDETGRPVQGVNVELASSRLATRRGATVTVRGAAALSGLQLRFLTRQRRTITAPVELSTAAETTAPATLDPRDPTEPTSFDRTRSISMESMPAILRVSPSPIPLDESGVSGVVTLEGRSLDKLSTGRVRSADGRLSLPVMFLPGDASTDTDTRRVQVVSKETLVAGPGGPRIVPNVPMQLVFDASSEAGAGTVVAPVEVVQPMPDLVVTGVQVGTPQETFVDVRYVIENRGLAHASISPQEPWIAEPFPNFHHVGPTPARFVAGGSGTMLTARLSYDSLSDAGTYVSTVTVPENLRVGGSGEGPREMPFTVIVEPPARPDLVIGGVSHSPASLVAGTADSPVPEWAHFSVQVLNQGERSASFRQSDHVRAADCAFFSSTRIGGSEIEPDGSLTATVYADMRGVDPGSYTCTFHVDYSVSGFWREADAANNSFTYSFDVLAP